MNDCAETMELRRRLRESLDVLNLIVVQGRTAETLSVALDLLNDAKTALNGPKRRDDLAV